MPQVSVIIPTFNDSAHITQAVDSVLNQTYRDFEVIVVDDGSTDGTDQILSAYGSLIRAIRQENRERSAARNTGIRIAKGSFIAFLDSDDYWLSKKLERQMKLFAADPELGLVFSQAYQVDEQGKHLGLMGRLPAGRPDIVYEQLFWGTFIPSPTPIFRRECLERIGGYDENLRQGEDWDLYLRVAAEYRLGFVDEPLASYRMKTSAGALQRIADRDFIQAHLRIIEKAAAIGKIRPEQIQIARGLTWLEGALIWFTIGDTEHARLSIDKALTEEPGLFERYGDLTTQRLADIAAKSSRGDPSGITGMAFLQGFFELLDSTATHRRALRKALGHYQANSFFSATQVCDDKQVLNALGGMIWNDPACLSNRGVWSIGLMSGIRTLIKIFRDH